MYAIVIAGVVCGAQGAVLSGFLFLFCDVAFPCSVPLAF